MHKKIKNDINLIIWRVGSKRLKTSHFLQLTPMLYMRDGSLKYLPKQILYYVTYYYELEKISTRLLLKV